MRKSLVATVVAVAALALAGVAQAHVTVHPNVLPSGAFTVVNVRVPNERDKASTVKVDVQLPSGIYFASTPVLPGWKVTVTYRTLTKPVELFGQQITREADRVLIRSTGSRIGPGQFKEFPLSIRVPQAKKGTRLTFKTVQTYSNGEAVRWIEAPTGELPAPQVLVTSASAPIQDYAELPSPRKSGYAFALPVALLGAAGLGLLRRVRS